MGGGGGGSEIMKISVRISFIESVFTTDTL